MNKQVKVSVVVPVYNASGFLHFCIDSILAQTEQNWELILVDDGSTDDSGAICDRYAVADNRIEAFHTSNGGVSAARNIGIHKATGKYLCFVDADDWVEPQYLEILCNAMPPGQMAICGAFLPDEAFLLDETITVRQMQKTPSRYAQNLYLNYLWNRLYCTELIQKHGLAMDETMHRGEDAVFVLSYLQHCQMVCVTTQKLYHYRANPASAMHRFYEKVCRDEAILIQRQYEFFHEEPLCSAEEKAYAVWEHGKCMAVLRYIACSAPTARVRTQLIKQAMQIPRLRIAISEPPKELGPKSKLYSAMVRMNLFPLLGDAIKLLQ